MNAVNRMIEADINGVEFMALNTDAQSLQQSAAHVTLQIGADITRGLGSGSDPERGRSAAMEDYDRIKGMLPLQRLAVRQQHAAPRIASLESSMRSALKSSSSAPPERP